MKKYTLINLLLLSSMLITSCAGEQEGKTKGCHSSLDKNHLAKAGNTSSPFLTISANGSPLLSWILENENPEENILCFASWDQKIESFIDTVAIAASKGVKPNPENMPKIIFEPGGRAVAVWGIANPSPQNKYSGLVYYSVSSDQGKNWGEAIALVNDPKSYDQRYFDLSLNKDGKTSMIWLDNRKAGDADGSTLFFATMGEDGYFVGEKEICQSVCQCCRTDLFTDSEGNLHAGFRKIYHDTIRDMAYVFSTDNGNTFSQPKRISPDNWILDGCPHTGPTITENSKGLHFAWYTQGTGEGVFYCKTDKGEANFTAKEAISANILAKHPQATTLSDGKIAIVWDEASKSVSNSQSQVGIQVRDEAGKIIRSKLIGEKGKSIVFPVVMPLSNHKLLIAFTSTNYEDSQVAYRMLNTK